MQVAKWECDLASSRRLPRRNPGAVVVDGYVPKATNSTIRLKNRRSLGGCSRWHGALHAEVASNDLCLAACYKCCDPVALAYIPERLNARICVSTL